ncbi:uncharacterized protein LTR77_007223 [Saxophila tyrrhenica]|uniref:AB hydrolase-1 domain-containing protein n=1 Tax=Saxophila tyrrhenica TaxID=1690608 RepID=A0AAV9P729_9PEZI|nr:hypothetical protein LTR77_007223 [Saxophila tyrrhenica]
MKSTILTATLLLTGGSVASPHSTHRYGTCQQFDVPITASAEGAVYNLTHIDDNISARSWAIKEDTWSTLKGADRIIKNITISGTYKIHVQLCQPHSSKQPDVIQIATHGGHYDSRYWDAKLQPEEHSWVEDALKAGYPILTYDRLGAGKSDLPDAYHGVQAGLELEILRELTIKTRDGTLHDGMKQSSKDPMRIIHVGHSFGSFLTSAFIATYPELSDAAVITGYAATPYLAMAGYSPWAAQFPPTADKPFDRTPGYIVNQKSGIQNIFFAGDPDTAFTKELLDYGDAIKQPVPIGELASGYKLVGLPGLNYTGPIHFMLAEFDTFICGGDCKGVTNETAQRLSYPKAFALQVDIQPNTGHAFPLHNNASAGFQNRCTLGPPGLDFHPSSKFEVVGYANIYRRSIGPSTISPVRQSGIELRVFSTATATPTPSSMSHPQSPQRQPTDNETIRYAKALHNTALVALVACPILALLPPRKLDAYTFGLGGTTIFSANWLVRERTGRSIWQHVGIGADHRAYNQSMEGNSSISPTEQANLYRELHHATQEMERTGRQEKASVTEQVQNQREAWKAQQQKEVQEEMEEGKSFADMITDQIWEVWNWGKKKDEDE